MPDFNKGDFTQQGVAGHVNANLRLNEKRLVNIDLTSNEEAEGCTITGTVKDLLNDKVYGIGSGVSGNIEITENGENINVAPYATATVNVAGGGGSIPLCTATIDNAEGGQDIPIACFNEDGHINIVSVLEGSTAVVKMPYCMVGENIAALFDLTLGQPIMPEEESYVTNLVNMTLSEGMLIITDPTADSSVTLDGRLFSVN